MHKRLEADLISLAHSVLQMKNKKDVFALKEKSQEIYEKLSLLAFIEEFVNGSPNLGATKNKLIDKIEAAIALKDKLAEKEITLLEKLAVDENTSEEEEVKNEVVDIVNETIVVENIIEQPFDELEALFQVDENVNEDVQGEESSINNVDEAIINNEEKVEPDNAVDYVEIKQQSIEELETLFGIDKNVKDDVKDVAGISKITLEDELKDIISVDVAADMFEKVAPRSLNDQLQTNIQIGLNDRIAFVKNLFNGSQEDFNRVVSQLNTLKTEKEAKKFINKMVKPDYNWGDNEELEARFMEIIERRFV